MSRGYCGLCKKVAEDDDLVFYTYGGENWNLDHNTWGDISLQDGLFFIYKQCLEEPEIHVKTKRLPSGRKKQVTKRITHSPSIKECKNSFRKPSTASTDYIVILLITCYYIFFIDTKSMVSFRNRNHLFSSSVSYL